MLRVTRTYKRINVVARTAWGKVRFTRMFGKNGWGPWIDTREGRSAKRIPDRYSYAEFMEVLIGIAGSKRKASAAMLYILELESEIENEDRRKLDGAVWELRAVVMDTILELKKRGCREVGRSWLRDTAKSYGYKLSKRVRELADYDRERALEYALDESTVKGFAVDILS